MKKKSLKPTRETTLLQHGKYSLTAIKGVPLIITSKENNEIIKQRKCFTSMGIINAITDLPKLWEGYTVEIEESVKSWLPKVIEADLRVGQKLLRYLQTDPIERKVETTGMPKVKKKSKCSFETVFNGPYWEVWGADGILYAEKQANPAGEMEPLSWCFECEEASCFGDTWAEFEQSAEECLEMTLTDAVIEAASRDDIQAYRDWLSTEVHGPHLPKLSQGMTWEEGEAMTWEEEENKKSSWLG